MAFSGRLHPTRLTYFQAKSGWEGFMVEPLLTFEYRFEGGRGVTNPA